MSILKMDKSISDLAARLPAVLLALLCLAHAGYADEPLKPVNLRSTADFAVLAGSLVSNIPTSAITGDIGLSPAAGSKITGFGDTEVTGTLFTVDATGPAGSVTAAEALTEAQGDLTLAYNDAAGREPVPAGDFLNPGAGNIGGLTLEPGLYKSTGALEITGSDLTLSGGEHDVWIFQIASDLNVGDGIKVTLEGGALAANVFWQVGTSATLGTTSEFKGTILADQSISLKTGATLDGRALASIAAVTLASSTVKVPPPAPATAVAKRPSAQESGMFQKYAYPITPMSRIEFRVPFAGMATLKLVDGLGVEVATLFNGAVQAGVDNQARFGALGLGAGLYFSKLESNGRVQVKKLILAD